MFSPELGYAVCKLVYKGLIRDILVKVVLDTKTEWDDGLLELADKVFDYKKSQGSFSISELQSAIKIGGE